MGVESAAGRGVGVVSDADSGRLKGFERIADWIEHLCTAADQPELFPEVSADGGPFTRWQACKFTHGRAGRSRRAARMDDEEKKKKYDRQLRLWGEARLGDARVCLFTADATGTEIIQNIILPAVDSVTIVDDQMVEPAVLGSSSRDSVGRPQ